jgi:hypothetical protein
VKGEPVRFVRGHQSRGVAGRRKQYATKIGPLRLCACGCGDPVLRVGARWLPGHHGRRSLVDYVVDAAGCWIWQRKVTWRGYGIVGHEGREIAAHRWVWLRERGELDPALDLHHRCGNRICVNPDHLEPIGRFEHRRLHHEARRRAA